MRTAWLLVALGAALALLAWTVQDDRAVIEGFASGAGARAQEPAHRSRASRPAPTLFRALPAAARPASPTMPASVPVVLDRAAAQAAAVRGTLDILLPDGTRYPVRHERDETAPDGNWTFVGRVDTPAGALAAVLTFGQDAVFGTLPTPDGTMLKLTTRGGQAYLQDAGWSIPPGADPSRDLDYVPSGPRTALAASAHASAAQRTTVEAGAEGATTARSHASGDGLVTIDILAAYTGNLVQLRGSEVAVQTEYRNLFAVMNQAHIDSGTRARFDIAGFVRINYPATAHNEKARSDIIANTLPDGTNLHKLRDQVAADLVSLIRPYVEGDLTCGISQFPGDDLNPHVLDSATGYSVTAVEACAPLVYAHEIGHNLGLMHDRETVAGAHGATMSWGAWPFSFGHRQLGPPGFATVMAYDTASRPWIAYFSHPGTQICAGVACGDAALADNVRGINLVAGTIARFRDPPGGISIADYWLSEGGPHYGTSIQVKLSSPAPAGGVAFDIGIEGGTAVLGEDYALWPGASLTGLTIPQGGTSAFLTLRILPDDIVEPTETVDLRLRNVRGVATILDDHATLGIVDDDTSVRIAGTVRFPPGVPRPPSAYVQAIAVKDGVSHSYDAGVFPPRYDYAFDVPQGAHVRLWAVGGTLTMQQHVIEDASRSMHTVDLRLRETNRLSGTVRNATGQPMSGVRMILWNPDGDGYGWYANWNGSGYGATYGWDALAGVAMQLEVRDPPAPYVRQIVELPRIEAPASYDIQLRTVPSLTIPHVSIVEGSAADGERTVLLTASLSVPRSQTGVSFDLQVSGTADDTDYQLPVTRLTIPKFRSRVEVPIVIVGDDTPEPDETIELRITNITGAAWNPGPGSVRIVDDDPKSGQGSRCTGTTRRVCE